MTINLFKCKFNNGHKGSLVFSGDYRSYHQKSRRKFSLVRDWRDIERLGGAQKISLSSKRMYLKVKCVKSVRMQNLSVNGVKKSNLNTKPCDKIKMINNNWKIVRNTGIYTTYGFDRK